jgi:drug/metabolite transporter (DMT)-like permease
VDARTRSRIEILAAAALFSTGGVAIKACELTAWQIAAFRSAIGAVTLLLLVPGARRGWTRRTLVVGLAYAGTLFLFVQANKHTTAANAIFLQATAPLHLLLLSPLLLGEPIRRREWPFVGAMALGLALFFVGRETPQATAPDPALGNVLAAASGLTWALTLARRSRGTSSWPRRASRSPSRSRPAPSTSRSSRTSGCSRSGSPTCS